MSASAANLVPGIAYVLGSGKQEFTHIIGNTLGLENVRYAITLDTGHGITP